MARPSSKVLTAGQKKELIAEIKAEIKTAKVAHKELMGARKAAEKEVKVTTKAETASTKALEALAGKLEALQA